MPWGRLQGARRLFLPPRGECKSFLTLLFLSLFCFATVLLLCTFFSRRLSVAGTCVLNYFLLFFNLSGLSDMRISHKLTVAPSMPQSIIRRNHQFLIYLPRTRLLFVCRPPLPPTLSPRISTPSSPSSRSRSRRRLHPLARPRPSGRCRPRTRSSRYDSRPPRDAGGPAHSR